MASPTDMSDLPDDAASTPAPGQGRGDPSWIAPALTTAEKTRVVGKTSVFFGPPLAILAEGQKNTMEISGKLNRTAERYLEILRHHGLELTEPERLCLAHICHIGFMSPLEIRELPLEVELTRFECAGLDKAALAAKLESASFADLVAVVETLGF
ncbi:hypothetical protein [Sulfurisoma sediminicola]|uniref:Uncharacterized protein n=1 Tax=Sulfurisoma sediminicola TaxID=1381557 RepID=A0A497X8J0_9PROT|nr:hypothetical protein [Sulfurisoma sediminicola]RLJ62114.1 hypothetical protein DFR35_2757 [Sulfurisoma sediminicola]